MKRRIFSISAILGVLLLVALLVSSHSVFALTPTISRTPTRSTPSKTPTRAKTPSRTPTLTSTPTSTITPTGSVCLATPTPWSYFNIDEVVSPTNATTQVINVTVIDGVSVTVTSEAGAFTSTTPSASDVFSVTINLVPNSINHLQVQGKIYRDGCTYYTTIKTVDNFGNPLTIIQGNAGPSPTPTASISPTPSANACSPVNAVIASPFTFDGVGTFCWQATTIVNYINSFSTSSVKVNGVNFTNLWAAPASLPPKIGGYWYISYSGSVPWSHFEAK